MRLQIISRAVSLAFFFAIAACGGGGNIAPGSSTRDAVNALSVATASTRFTEYATPSGLVPVDITMGPGGEPWFATFQAFDSSNVAGGSVAANGAVTTYNVPSGLYSGSGAIAAAGGYAYTIATDPSSQDESLLLRMNGSNPSAQIGDLGVCCGSPVTKMIKATNGDIFLTVCGESCGSGSAFVERFTESGTRIFQVRLGDVTQAITYQANSLALGPDGRIYVTAVYTGPPGATVPDSSVFKLSATGTVLKQFALPSGSDPLGIVAGPDGNLWITENASGAIAKMTTSGVLTQYALASPHAGLAMITVGSDGALWFTKTNNGTLGRITTSGAISSYTIPTPNSQPFGIASPASCTCHVKIWFTEEIGKIGKFTY